MTDQPRILVIEDEAPIRRFLKAALVANGYQYEESATAEQGLILAASQPPDLVILDLGLPDLDGIEVIRRLREWTGLPIVILSARDQEKDKVAALDAGADDYLTKPFGVGELLARLRVALRHRAMMRSGGPGDGSDAGESTTFASGDLTVDLISRRVFLADEDVHLTPIEYRLLTTLIRHAGKVLTHRFLLKEVWGPGYVDQPHTLRVHAANLRRKIETDPAQPRHLLTEQGVGYRFSEE